MVVRVAGSLELVNHAKSGELRERPCSNTQSRLIDVRQGKQVMGGAADVPHFPEQRFAQSLFDIQVEIIGVRGMEILSHCKNAICDRVTTGIQALGTGDIPGGAGMRCLKNRTGGPGSPFSSTVCGWVCRKARVERNGGNGSDRYSPGRIGFYALRGTIRRVHVEKWIHPRRVEEDPEPRANHKATVDRGLVRKPDAGRKGRINLFVDRVDPT